jgi:hypothetical protein
MANRDYANARFLADFKNILAQPMNSYMIVDYAAQLFLQSYRWSLVVWAGANKFSTYTVNENSTSDKFPGYAMTGVADTYNKFQGFMDTFYQYANPLSPFAFNSDNYNFVSDQTGLYTRPTMAGAPAVGKMVMTRLPGIVPPPFLGNFTVDGLILPPVSIDYSSVPVTQANTQAALTAAGGAGWTVVVTVGAVPEILEFTFTTPPSGSVYNGTIITFATLAIGISIINGVFAGGTALLPASTMLASDSSVIAVGLTTDLTWETAWNTLLVPYENSIGAIFTGRYKQSLSAPPGDYPSLKTTSFTGIFRLGKAPIDTTLMNTTQSANKQSAYWIAIKGPERIKPSRFGRRNRLS